MKENVKEKYEVNEPDEIPVVEVLFTLVNPKLCPKDPEGRPVSGMGIHLMWDEKVENTYSKLGPAKWEAIQDQFCNSVGAAMAELVNNMFCITQERN